MAESPDTYPLDPSIDDDGGWAILEIMGHKKLAGFCRTVERFGARLLEITTPQVETPSGTRGASTHLFGPSAIFCLTWTTEESARRVSEHFHYDPIQRWELPEIARREDGERPLSIAQYGRVQDDRDDDEDYVPFGDDEDDEGQGAPTSDLYVPEPDRGPRCVGNVRDACPLHGRVHTPADLQAILKTGLPWPTYRDDDGTLKNLPF